MCVFYAFFLLFALLPFQNKVHKLAAAVTRKTKDYSDSELISLYLREQNTSYFTLLYRRYAGKVFAKCISMLSDEGLARDATQDVFIKVLLNLGKFTEQSSFSTWVYSITYNYCIDIIRKKKKNIMIFSEDVGKISPTVDAEIPDSIILEMETKRLERVMEQMPPGDKAILNMKYIDDLQIKEIAEVLNKTESAIKMQIMRAKAKAQGIYEDLYGKEPISA